MQSTLKALALSSLALAFTTVAPRAFANPNGELGAHWGPRLHAMLKYANLTPDQQSQVQSILDKAAPQRKSLRQQSAALREQMAEKMLSSGPVTSADFTSLTQQDAQVYQQLVQLTLDVSVQIRTILTPAQISHVSQLHQQMKALNAQKKEILQNAAQSEDDEQ